MITNTQNTDRGEKPEKIERDGVRSVPSELRSRPKILRTPANGDRSEILAS